MSRYTATLDQPNATINVAAALDEQIEVLLSQPATTGATTIAAGSDGATLPQATINVASATSLATSGTAYVVTTQLGGLQETGPEAVTYTGKTPTTLIGCAGGTGVMSTGNAVTGNKLASWAGVDRWLTPDGAPPVLQKAANGLDYLRFRNIGGLVYGSHINAPGRDGADGAPGPVGFQNRGAHALATAYALNDIVTYLGSTYISIQAGTGHAPDTSPTYWDVVALSGGGSIIVPPDPIIVIDPILNDGTPTVSLDQPGVAARLVEWVSYTLLNYTDAQLGYLAQTLGINGLWLSTYMGTAVGGSWNFSSNPATVPANSLQQYLITNDVIARARNKGMEKFYLGLRASNPISSARTPYVDWFDDAGWANKIIPTLKNFAGAAKNMGFSGIGFDNEGYTMNNGLKPSWAWNYPGNTHTEAQVRAKVKQRGAEMMTAILSVFPNVDIMVYKATIDGGYSSLIQNVINGQPLNNYSATLVAIDFWDGMTSVSGYARVRFQNASFFLGAADIGGGADVRTCMTIDVNGTLAYLSQALSNWAYANQRVSMSPFSWLGPTNGDGPYTSNNCLTPTQGLALVQNMRIHGMSGLCANFSLELPSTLVPPATNPSGSFADFSSTNGRVVHGNFAPTYAAAVPGIVDSTDPTLSGIVVTRDNATTVHATGTANDNLGVRAIRWMNGSQSGAARHTFVVDGGGTYTTAFASFAWHIAWTASNIPATAGQTITFVVEDIKGRVALYTRTAPA